MLCGWERVISYAVDVVRVVGCAGHEHARLPRAERRCHCLRVLSACVRNSTQGFVHRDIKPNNVLYSFERRQTLLIDFGLVQVRRCHCLRRRSASTRNAQPPHAPARPRRERTPIESCSECRVAAVPVALPTPVTPAVPPVPRRLSTQVSRAGGRWRSAVAVAMAQQRRHTARAPARLAVASALN